MAEEGNLMRKFVITAALSAICVHFSAPISVAEAAPKAKRASYFTANVGKSTSCGQQRGRCVNAKMNAAGNMFTKGGDIFCEQLYRACLQSGYWDGPRTKLRGLARY